MAAAFVRESTFVSGSFLTATSMPLTGTPAAGNTLVYSHMSADPATTITSIVGCGATWTKVARLSFGVASSEMWVGSGCSGSGSSLTVNTTVGAAMVASISEFSGLVGTVRTSVARMDSLAVESTTNSGMLAPDVGDLVVSMVGDQNLGTLTPRDVPAAFTSLTSALSGNGYRVASGYRVATSTDPAARTWFRGNTTRWGAVTAVLPSLTSTPTPAGTVLAKGATSSLSGTVALVGTPATGDVIILTSASTGAGGGLTGVTGCGATWAKVGTYVASSTGAFIPGNVDFQNQTVEVWKGTGASSSGTITGTSANGVTPALTAHLVAGTNGAVSVDSTPFAGGAANPRQGPSSPAALGQVVIDVVAGMDDAATTYPAATTPSGWSTSYAGLVGSFARVWFGHRIPAETTGTPHSTAMTNLTSARSLAVQITVGTPTATVVEWHAASFVATTTAGTGVDLTFATTPQAGDVVVAVMALEGNPLGGSESFSGLGATFVLARTVAFQGSVHRYSLFIGTGANAAGVLRATRVTGGGSTNARAFALLVRGLPSATLYTEKLSTWTTADVPGVGNSINLSTPVGPNTLVFGLTMPYGAGTQFTFPSAASSPGFITDAGSLGVGTWPLAVGWQAFSAASTPNQVTLGVTAGSGSYFPIAVYYIGGPDGAREAATYAEIATSSPSALAIDGGYAEAITRGGPGDVVVDAGYLEVLTQPVGVYVVTIAKRAVASLGTAPTVTLAATPRPGDVVILVLEAGAATTLMGVSGLGATWTVDYQPDPAAGLIHAVAMGVGATAAGVITATLSSSRNGILYAYLIRGLAASPTVAGVTAATAAGLSLAGAAQSAGPGSIVIEMASVQSTSGTYTWPSAQTPPGAFTTEALEIGTATRFNAGHAIPATTSSYSTSATSSSNFVHRISQVVVAGAVAGEAGFWGMLSFPYVPAIGATVYPDRDLYPSSSTYPGVT